jgi:hypothetical protein
MVALKLETHCNATNRDGRIEIYEPQRYPAIRELPWESSEDHRKGLPYKRLSFTRAKTSNISQLAQGTGKPPQLPLF